MALNLDKYRQTILYLLHECDNQHLGVVKLMRLLYFVDFDHFEQFRSSLTGDVYRRLPRGPVPSSAAAVLDDMVLDGEIVPLTVEVGDFKQYRYEPQVAYDLSEFCDGDRQILAAVVRRWRDVPSKEIEQASHDELPWLVTKPNEVIPYVLAFHRATPTRLTTQERQDMILSAIGSQSIEGVELSFDDAACILEAVLQEPPVTID